jgi:hypothetical protein
VALRKQQLAIQEKDLAVDDLMKEARIQLEEHRVAYELSAT